MGKKIMCFDQQKSLKFFSIVILSIIVSACGGGGSDDSGSQQISVVSTTTRAPDTSTGPGPTPAPAPPAELASRVQGVAPLAVFFDSINVPGVAQPPEVNGRREYADFDYTWNFNDPSSGTWATSGRSKNEASGYVAAHVFESPGTYTVTLSVKDGISVDETHQVTITVEDPDTVYAGSATICVSSTNVFTGCPGGAIQLNTTTVTDIGAYIAADRRILFRRGDSWTTNATFQLRNAGRLTIGAYGECASPDARGICSNAPVLNLTGTNTFFNTENLSDARMMDLRFVDAGSVPSIAGGNTGLERQLYLRLKIDGFGTSLGSGNWNTGGHDQIAYVDNDLYQPNSYALYTGSERLIILGNSLRDSQVTHVARVWQSYKGVISHNEISGSSITNNTGRHALKLHGPNPEKLAADTTRDGLDNPTRFTIISDNLFGQSGPWPVAIGAADAGDGSYLEDIVIENNNFFPGWGTPSCCSTGVQIALSVWSSYVTVRNNIFSGEGSSKYYTAITIRRRGVEPVPTGNRVFNNTIYKSDYAGSGSAYSGISTGVNALNTTIQNNLIHLNQTAPVTMISDSGTNTVESNNLLTNPPGLVDPDNANFLAKDFSLELSSPAVNAGTNVPVFKDKDGTERTLGGATDLGAYERQ